MEADWHEGGSEKNQIFLELPVAPLPNPDASGVTDALLILRQCNPALVACVGILVFGCLPVYWIPPLLISSIFNWVQTQKMYFANMHFSKME